MRISYLFRDLNNFKRCQFISIKKHKRSFFAIIIRIFAKNKVTITDELLNVYDGVIDYISFNKQMFKDADATDEHTENQHPLRL